jgi:hypothetical protein
VYYTEASNFHCYASTPFEFSPGKRVLLNMLWQAAILPHHAIHTRAYHFSKPTSLFQQSMQGALDSQYVSYEGNHETVYKAPAKLHLVLYFMQETVWH